MASVVSLMVLLALSAAPCCADDYKVKYTYDSSTNKVLTNVGSNSTIPEAQSGQMRGQSNYVKKVQAEQRKVKKVRAAIRKAAANLEATAPNNSSASEAPATAATFATTATTASTASTAFTATTGVTASPTAAAKKNASSAQKKRPKPSSGAGQAPSGRTVVYHSGGNLKIQTIDDAVLPPPQVEYSYAPQGLGEGWAFATFNASKRQPRLVRYFGWHRDETGQDVQGWYDVDLNPLILAAGKATGVDPLLIEIVMRHESNFNPYAKSPAGAVGLMQLMPGTASGLGVSDVYNVRDNIRGGAQYLAYQLARFNSVPLALASYNAGPGAVLEYGGVPPYAETQNYVRMIYGEYKEALRRRNAER